MENSTPRTTNESVNTEVTPEDFDWEKLSDIEEDSEDEIEYIHNSTTPSFAETAQNDADALRITQEFESEFPVVKKNQQ